MTAEEYIKYYASGQGGFESVSVDVALRAIEYAKQEMKQQLMKDAVDATVHFDAGGYPYIPQMELYDYDKDESLTKEGNRVKVVVVKED